MTASAGAGRTAQPLVVCTVGTDYHPFDRLVRWCDSLAEAQRQIQVEVQYGASAPPRSATGDAFWSKERLAERLSAAHVVITHGGPGSISEAQRAGTRPIVVPRDPTLGEHVDGHQQRFVARLHAAGAVVAVASETELIEEVTRRLGEPRQSGHDAVDAARARASALRFGQLIDELLVR